MRVGLGRTERSSSLDRRGRDGHDEQKERDSAKRDGRGDICAIGSFQMRLLHAQYKQSENLPALHQPLAQSDAQPSYRREEKGPVGDTKKADQSAEASAKDDEEAGHACLEQDCPVWSLSVRCQMGKESRQEVLLGRGVDEARS